MESKLKRTLELNSYSVGNRLDTTGPQRLVEFGVEPDIGGAHCLLGELYNGLDGMGGTLLEGAAVYPLVEVDGVFTGDNILESRASLAGL